MSLGASLASQMQAAEQPSSPVPSTPSSDASSGIIIAAGLVTGIVMVLAMISLSVALLYYRRRVARRNQLAAVERSQQSEELVEGDPGAVKIPVIVVLPDNKLRFAWELPSGAEGGAAGLERYPSSSIKSSHGSEHGEEEEGEGEGGSSSGSDLEAGAGQRDQHSGGAATPARRCRPPMTSVIVHVVDENF